MRVEDIRAPSAHQVRVRVLNSAISPGTEMLFYRGQVPRHMAVDSTLDGMDDAPAYPMRYGYAAVGEVTAVGAHCDPAWHGKRVFAFQPHASHFNATPSQLLTVPDAVSTEAATLFPNLETAVSLLHDSAPRVGERVVVFGQGIVGLLTTWLLATHALEKLTVVDPVAARRARGRQLGADLALEPNATAHLTA
ncbi:MAG: zinc-binding alcohol dehydrogenase, partial [Litorilinea sp.]